MWLGLFLSLFSVFTTPHYAIFDAIAILTYGLLWITAIFYRLIRGKQVIIHGDFKMPGMIDSWLMPG
ncbi:hypothetical protein [Coxiella-like endosymbiont]|uniref:hypothetical protein n=1 Tax=Coxiella-like endosymbiont TaxID=1592897 RepID=UPI00272DA475|nr:hypothetical protein [Coxiella-like endosymbiont]